MTRDGLLDMSIAGDIGDKVYAEALFIPDETFEGYPVLGLAGSKTELTYTVRTLVPNERFVLVGENKTVKATDTMTFTDTGHGTRVTYNASFAFQGFFGKVAPLLSPVLASAMMSLSSLSVLANSLRLRAFGHGA